METAQRNSNIELLRILLMIFVITSHFNGMACHILDRYTEGFGYYFTRIIQSFAVCAVDCFILISGYFFSYNKKIKIQKIVDILFIVIGIALFNFVLRSIIEKTFSLKSLVASFIPQNYYATFYIILYLLSPFITKLFDSFKNQKQATIFMAIILFLFSVFPFTFEFAMKVTGLTFGGLHTIDAFNGSGSGYTIVNFLLLFFVGSYLNRYKIVIKKSFLVIGYLASFFVIFILYSFVKHSASSYASPFVITNALCLFLLFSKLNFSNNFINYVSKATFGVFCMHTSSMFNNVIFPKLELYPNIHTNVWGGVIINSLVAILGMTAICYAIDLVLRLIIKPVRKILYNNKLINKGIYVE